MFRMVFHRNKSGEYCIIYRINAEVVDVQVQKKIDENRYLVLPITLNTLNTLKVDYETVNKLVINQLDNM